MSQPTLAAIEYTQQKVKKYNYAEIQIVTLFYPGGSKPLHREKFKMASKQPDGKYRFEGKDRSHGLVTLQVSHTKVSVYPDIYENQLTIVILQARKCHSSEV